MFDTLVVDVSGSNVDTNTALHEVIDKLHLLSVFSPAVNCKCKWNKYVNALRKYNISFNIFHQFFLILGGNTAGETFFIIIFMFWANFS